MTKTNFMFCKNNSDSIDATELFKSIESLGENIAVLFKSEYYIRPSHCRECIALVNQRKNSLEELYQIVTIGRHYPIKEPKDFSDKLHLSMAACKLKTDLEELLSKITEFKIISTVQTPEKTWLAKDIRSLARIVIEFSAEARKECEDNKTTNSMLN